MHPRISVISSIWNQHSGREWAEAKGENVAADSLQCSGCCWWPEELMKLGEALLGLGMGTDRYLEFSGDKDG